VRRTVHVRRDESTRKYRKRKMLILSMPISDRYDGELLDANSEIPASIQDSILRLEGGARGRGGGRTDNDRRAAIIEKALSLSQ